jgi:hypothetical protein
MPILTPSPACSIIPSVCSSGGGATSITKPPSLPTIYSRSPAGRDAGIVGGEFSYIRRCAWRSFSGESSAAKTELAKSASEDFPITASAFLRVVLNYVRFAKSFSPRRHRRTKFKSLISETFVLRVLRGAFLRTLWLNFRIRLLFLCDLCATIARNLRSLRKTSASPIRRATSRSPLRPFCGLCVLCGQSSSVAA